MGHSSRNLPLSAVITVEAPRLALPLTAWSTLREWRDDPVGSRILDEVAAPGSMLADQDLTRVIGSFPMSTLASFPNLGFDHDRLAKMIATWRETTGSS